MSWSGLKFEQEKFFPDVRTLRVLLRIFDQKGENAFSLSKSHIDVQDDVKILIQWELLAQMEEDPDAVSITEKGNKAVTFLVNSLNILILA